MNRIEAMRILASWRPGVDDSDPFFAEALAFAQADPELLWWVEEERARYAAIRGKLLEIEPPKDLARTIIAGRPIPMRPAWSGRQILQLAAAIILLAGVAFYWLRPGPRNDIATYEKYLTRVVAQGYRMSLESNDPARIRRFLASNQAPADYAVTAALERATPLGCATLSWNGNPVTMLCFRDRPGRDVYLFVVDREAIPKRTPNPSPRIEQFGDYSAATWESGGKTYVLTVRGEPDVVQSYL
jgi:hypothetical protein